MSAIKKQLVEEMERIYKEEVERMTKRFEQRKGEIVAGTVLNITREIQVDQMRDQLTIIIRNEKN